MLQGIPLQVENYSAGLDIPMAPIVDYHVHKSPAPSQFRSNVSLHFPGYVFLYYPRV